MTTDFYRAFEDKLRGSRELIRGRIEVYLPFILPLKTIYPDKMALDIGCGRGEWLELLKDNGISAQGVDLDEGMLKLCRINNLDVFKGDGIEFLKKQLDESLIIVSAFHVVEHIPFATLQFFISEALRVLKPGGVLIMETPNPENIKVATENFYLDPTHIKPIPSKLLSFLPEFYGFERTKILRLQERKDLKTRENINLLEVIEGVSPDYAVVAQKKADSEILEQFDDVFSLDMGLPLATLSSKFENRLQKIEAKAAEAEAKAAKAEAKAAEAEAKAVQAEAKAAEAEAKAVQAETTAIQAEAKAEQLSMELSSVYNSHSWRITAPLRLGNAFMRKLKASVFKSYLKQLLQQTFLFLSRHPRLKKTATVILGHMPYFRERLRSVFYGSNDEFSKQLKNTPIELANLTPHAHNIYANLKTALDGRQKEG